MTINATTTPVNPVLVAEQRRAIAVAAATAAAAEAAVATAQAAVEVVRLTRPNNFAKEQYAATLIQTAFRGYLVSEPQNINHKQHMKFPYTGSACFFELLHILLIQMWLLD